MAGTPADEAPLQAVLLRMMTGYWVTQAIYVAAKLGVADMLADGPRRSDELAALAGADDVALYRLLRALASVGVFTEVEPGTFGLTPMADLLRSDAPNSMRSLAIMYSEEQYRAWGDALHAVRTGEPAFDHVFGSPYFPYIAAHPEASETFDRAMTGWSAQVDGALIAAYDFSKFRTIVDIGGGHGRMLAAILAASPQSTGVLFDQPHVVAGAAPLLQAAGVADRCGVVGGDFFREVPEGGDAYLLAQIIHDWDDDHATAILASCRRAIAPGGTLLLAEMVISSGDTPDLGKFLDLHMMVLLGGRERTEEQYRALLDASGFSLTQVVRTPTGTCLIEAMPV